MNDFDIRGTDIDQRYAKFGRTPLTDQDIWNLGKANIVCPSPDGISAKLFITSRSEVTGFAHDIRDWALALGAEIAKAMYRPKGSKRRVQYSQMESERARKQAALDGVTGALFGFERVPTLYERRVEFHVDERSYRKIRDFVGGCAVNLIANFRFALEWAWGYSTSRELDRLYDEFTSNSPMLGYGEYAGACETQIPEEQLFTNNRLKASEGNYRQAPLPSSDNQSMPGWEEYQGSPAGFAESTFYNEAYEAQMRVEALEAKSTPGKETPVEHDPRGAVTPHPTRSTGRRETHQPAGVRRRHTSSEDTA